MSPTKPVPIKTPPKSQPTANGRVEPAPAVDTSQALAFITTGELEELILPELQWLIEGILPRGLVSAIIGQSGSGKTWLALLWLRLFATGGMFAGKFSVKKCKAALVDAEDSFISLKNRWHQLNVAHGPLPAGAIEPGVVSDIGGINVLNSLWEQRLEASARMFDVLIIDSLSKSHSLDESSADMREVMETFARISRATGCTILLLHHAGWTPSGQIKQQRGRGSSTIRDALQSELFLSRDDRGPNIRLTLTKNKSGPLMNVGSMQIVGTSGGGVELSFEEAGDTSPGQERRECILQLLRANGPMGYSALRDMVAETTKHGKSTVELEIKAMASSGLIVQPKERGPYQLP